MAIVEVPHIMVDLLVVPLQPTILEGQGENRVGEQVHAGPLGAVTERVADGDVEHAELGIDRRGLPDPPALASSANPGRTGNLPPLIGFVLRNRVEVPDDLSGLGINREDMTARNEALATGRADVDHTVVDLGCRREPVPHRYCRFDIRVSLPEHIQDRTRLSVVAESLDRFTRRGVEREDERAGGAVHHAIGVGHTAVPEDVTLAPTPAQELCHVVCPQVMSVGGVERVHAAT